MHLIKYIIEHSGVVTINNEHTVDLQKPLLIEWFENNELLTSPTLQKIKINDATFILRTPPVIARSASDEAIQSLHTVLGHVRITKKDESYVAIKNTPPTPTDIELPFAFLQCVALGDYENARAMLSFEISDEHLKNYFGDFEVLLNNYLDTPNTVSILPKGADTAKTFTFEIKDGKIININ